MEITGIYILSEWGWTVREEEGRQYAYKGFSVDSETEEPHDVAWSELCSVQHKLNEIGMKLEDSGSDNDTVWGYLVPLKE